MPKKEKSESEALATSGAMMRDDVMQMLGAARYAEWIADQSASHVMQFLMTVEDQKLYLATGDASFVDFLERSGLKKKSSYYNHRKLLLNEGPELFDVMEQLGIPARIRRQITAGDVRLDGKDVYIGGELFDPGSPTIAKQVIEQLVKEKIKAEEDAADNAKRLELKADKLEAVSELLEKVDRENETLRSQIAYLKEKPTHDAIFTDLVARLRTFTDSLDYMEAEDRDQKAPMEMAIFERCFAELKDAYNLTERVENRKKAMATAKK